MSTGEEPPAKKSRTEDTPAAEPADAANANSSTEPVTHANTNNDNSPLEVFSKHILTDSEQYAKTYSNAEPYPHGVLEQLFINGFAEKVLHEVKHNLKAKYKESDLFRVYQSIDLANLKPNHPNLKLDNNMPATMALRKSLYSTQWRNHMEDIACLSRGTLTDQVDCAINCHDKGCHLLCHDDVIGTRKVSYILYLTDPEPDWCDTDGGRLELYDSMVLPSVSSVSSVSTSSVSIPGSEMNTEGACTGERAPGVFPVKTILPKHNSMAYFVVEPGRSFHSVQEVFCDRPRLSIQGWYHAKELPKHMEQASLSQLKKNNVGEHDFEGDFMPMIDTDGNDNGNDNGTDNETDTMEFTQEDKDFLSQYINKTYLRPESIQEICTHFEEDSSVQLRHFFNLDWEKKVSDLLQMEDEECCIGRDRTSLDYTVGVSNDWIPVGPAHKQRFLEYVGVGEDLEKNGNGNENGNETMTCGSILKHLKEKVMQSPQFGRLLKSYTSLGMPLGYRGRIRRFRPGLDYTIAHYGILTRSPVLDATMCFVSGNGNQSTGNDDDDDMLWQSDDKGGFECYIEADDDGDDDDEKEGQAEAEDEYNEEDDTKLLSVSACNNTLSLVYRDPGTMRFVKYLGIGAPSSRWDLSLEYEVEDDNEGSEEGDAKDGNGSDESEDGNVDVGF